MFKCETKLAKEVLDLQRDFSCFLIPTIDQFTLQIGLITLFLKGELLLHPHTNTPHREGIEAISDYRMTMTFH